MTYPGCKIFLNDFFIWNIKNSQKGFELFDHRSNHFFKKIFEIHWKSMTYSEFFSFNII